MAEDHFVRRLSIYSVMPALHIPLGIWLLASPYFLQYTIYESARVNALTVGPFLVAFALTRLAVTPGWFWVGWVNVILGAWLIIAPFAFGVTHVTDLTINFIVVGAVVLITAVLGQFEPVEINEDWPGKPY